MANIRKELVSDFIRRYHPRTIQDLIQRIEDAGIASTSDAIIEAVHELQLEGEVGIYSETRAESFISYLSDFHRVWWFYGCVSVSLIVPLLVVYSNTTIVLALLRGILGIALLGYLPGYATVKALFPRDRLSSLEYALLSIFLSVAVSIAIGVILGAGYVFTGIANALGSASFTIVASFLAGYREYSASRERVKK